MSALQKQPEQGFEVSHLGHFFETSNDDTVQVLSDISFSIESGEIVSFVGRSGCGKSTLLNILAGLLTPTHGKVTLFARPANNRSRSDGRLPDRAYITQDDRLLPWRSALQNVELPLELHHVDKDQRRDQAADILKRVGLGDALNKRPFELSGGMRQRVAVAQALVYNPSALLMDEPFGALDAWTRQSLHQLLIDVHSELNTTTVLVTHDIFEALSLSDRVITLASYPGRIIREFRLPKAQRPRPHHALQTGEYAAIYEAILDDLQLK
jgi:NitT/TauT family transport system ATP-binding protein